MDDDTQPTVFMIRQCPRCRRWCGVDELGENEGYCEDCLLRIFTERDLETWQKDQEWRRNRSS